MLGQATSFFAEYFKATFAAGLILKMMNIPPKIDSFGRHGLRPVGTIDSTFMWQELTGRVRFNNVRFSYPTRPNHLVQDGLSFDVGAP